MGWGICLFGLSAQSILSNFMDLFLVLVIFNLLLPPSLSKCLAHKPRFLSRCILFVQKFEKIGERRYFSKSFCTKKVPVFKGLIFSPDI